MHAGDEYSQLDFNNMKFKNMKWFTTLVQNALLSFSNILLQSTVADMSAFYVLK